VALEAADALDAEQLPWAHALGLLLRAGVARRLGHDALPLLELAARLFAGEQMELHAWVARRALEPEAAEQWMASQQVRNPARMVAMIAPGV
jgi:hypothetical protein